MKPKDRMKRGGTPGQGWPGKTGRRAGILLAVALAAWSNGTAAEGSAPPSAPVAYRALSQFGGDFTLTDQNGQPFSLRDARGKLVLVAFGFTSCVETCPLILNKMTASLRRLGPLADRVQPLFISVDPATDTPAVLRDYLSHFDPSLIGLTGTEAEIGAVTKQYRAPLYVHRPEHGEQTVMDHSSKLYLVDPSGVLVNILALETPPEQVARIMRTLLEEPHA